MVTGTVWVANEDGGSLSAIDAATHQVRTATFSGEYISFDDVEMYPKPVQDPFPIYSAGHADASIRRAAQFCQGWLPAGIGPEAIRNGRVRLAEYAANFGRYDVNLQIARLTMVCLADSQEEAEETFKRSQLHHHLITLQQSTLKDVDPSTAPSGR